MEMHQVGPTGNLDCSTETIISSQSRNLHLQVDPIELLWNDSSSYTFDWQHIFHPSYKVIIKQISMGPLLLWLIVYSCVYRPDMDPFWCANHHKGSIRRMTLALTELSSSTRWHFLAWAHLLLFLFPSARHLHSNLRPVIAIPIVSTSPIPHRPA